MLFKLSTISLIACTLALAAGALSTRSAAAGGGGACHGSQQITDASTTTIALRRSCFTPTVARIAPGDTVTFTNEDPYLHEIHGAGLGWGSDQEPVYGGESITQIFADEGVFPYACYLHPGMSGAIVVDDGENEAAAPAGARRADADLVSASGAGANSPETTTSGSAQSEEDDGGSASVVFASGATAAVALAAGAASGALFMRSRRSRSA
jgi:plastocyanin